MVKKLFAAFVLFLFPASVSRFFFSILLFDNIKIERKVKIGFSIILAENIYISSGSKICNFNILKINSLKIYGGRIFSFNILKGKYDLVMESDAWMKSFNKITGPSDNYRVTKFTMKSKSAIITAHTIDMTSNVTIGYETTFAGSHSSVWTHGFYMGTIKNVRVDGDVSIGDKCYIGAQCVICAGVNITDFVAIGANSTVSKDLSQKGLYVSQPLRFIEYDGDQVISQLGKPVFGERIYDKTEKDRSI